MNSTEVITELGFIVVSELWICIPNSPSFKIRGYINFYPESEVLTVRTHISIDLYLQPSLSKRTKLRSCLLPTTAEYKCTGYE